MQWQCLKCGFNQPPNVFLSSLKVEYVPCSPCLVYNSAEKRAFKDEEGEGRNTYTETPSRALTHKTISREQGVFCTSVKCNDLFFSGCPRPAVWEGEKKRGVMGQEKRVKLCHINCCWSPRWKERKKKTSQWKTKKVFLFFLAVTHGGSTCSNKKRGNPWLIAMLRKDSFNACSTPN